MNDNDIEKLIKDSKGFDIKQGDILELLMLRTISNSFLSSEVLKRVLGLEQLIKSTKIDNEKLQNEFEEIINAISERATAKKNEDISELFLLNKE